jgi:hypothetical protein
LVELLFLVTSPVVLRNIAMAQTGSLLLQRDPYSPPYLLLSYTYISYTLIQPYTQEAQPHSPARPTYRQQANKTSAKNAGL